MEYLQELFKLPLKWEKMDSNITDRSYNPGEYPNGVRYSIWLYEHVDELSGKIMEETKQDLDRYPCQKIVCPQSQVTIRCKVKSLIYGKIEKVVNDDIIGDNMETHFLGGNKEWTEEIVNCVIYEAIGSYIGNLSGPRATNVIKFVHNWRNDAVKENILCREYGN